MKLFYLSLNSNIFERRHSRKEKNKTNPKCQICETTYRTALNKSDSVTTSWMLALYFVLANPYVVTITVCRVFRVPVTALKVSLFQMQRY